MARVGYFTGPTVVYGAPLSTVHPRDNSLTPASTPLTAEQVAAQEADAAYKQLLDLLWAKPKTTG